MIQDGLITEVLELIKEGHFNEPASPPANSIGYAETYNYLQSLV
jgi:tRNA A37 N6-isopentenylltransferase MiaA